MKRLETFQLKVLRKILRNDTTYVDRRNTNQTVFDRANQKLEEEGKNTRVVTFIQAYKKQKRKRALQIIRKPDSATHKISFNGDKLRKWTFPRRRVGRPRASWAEETVKEIWDHLKKDHQRYKYKAFDEDNEEIIQLIKTHAE